MTRIFSADMIPIARPTYRATSRARYAPAQSLRYTQTRAGGRFIQIRSEASVDTPGSDFGIGGGTVKGKCTNRAPGGRALKGWRVRFSPGRIGFVYLGETGNNPARGGSRTDRSR